MLIVWKMLSLWDPLPPTATATAASSNDEQSRGAARLRLARLKKNKKKTREGKWDLNLRDTRLGERACVCVCLFVCLFVPRRNQRAKLQKAFGLLCLPPGRLTRTPNKQERASFSHLDPELSPDAIAANLTLAPEHTQAGRSRSIFTRWIHYFWDDGQTRDVEGVARVVAWWQRTVQKKWRH